MVDEESEEFVIAKNLFTIASKIESSYNSLKFYMMAKEMFDFSIHKNQDFIPNHYYKSITIFRMGVIKFENGDFAGAIKDFEQSIKSFDMIKNCEGYSENLLEILPSVDEACSYVMQEFGDVIYHDKESMKRIDKKGIKLNSLKIL